jgi:hypothetical protein
MAWAKPRFAGLTWATTLALAAASVIGAENGAPEGLAGAKRDLEAVKAAAIPGAGATVRGLPTLDLPSLSPAGSENPGPPPLGPLPKLAPRPAGSDWLSTDAIDLSRSGHGPSATARGDRTRRDANDLGGDLQVSGWPQSDSAPLARDANVRELALLKAVNPLSPYLSGWISPQDFRLLAPAPESAGITLPSNAGQGTGDSLASAERLGSGIPADSSRIPASIGGPRSDASGRSANPYLEAFSSSSLAPNPTLKAPVPTPTSTPVLPPPTSAAALPSEPATSPTRVPDFVRPTTDEKYYKPMKRF